MVSLISVILLICCMRTTGVDDDDEKMLSLYSYAHLILTNEKVHHNITNRILRHKKVHVNVSVHSSL